MQVEELFANIPFVYNELTKVVYPHFQVRVAVIKARPPRHPAFDEIRDIGAGFLQHIFDGTKFRSNPNLILVFPERWMSVNETRLLMDKLHNHPQVKELKSVSIVTSSPVILTDFFAENMKIITFPDD